MTNENIKTALQDILVPEMRGINGRLDTIGVEIKRLDEKFAVVDQKFNSMKEEMRNMRDETSQRFDSIREELRNMRGDFRLAIDLHERIATLEAKLSR